jgi:hypothetical protein
VQRFIPILFAVLLAASPALVSSHTEHGKPLHGGYVAEAGLFQAELVDGAGVLTLHITKHGEPFTTQGGKAVVTAQGTARAIALQLLPSGENRFVAEGTLANSGAKRATAVISLPGLPERTLHFDLK